MEFLDAQAVSLSMQMRTRDDILDRALRLNEVAAGHGLRVLPWHNLGSAEPMTDGDGQMLSVTAFGWSGDEAWMHALTRRRYSPLADLCRYQAEPFWANEGKPLQSRHPSPYMAKIDTDWVWKIPGIRATLTVPLHMQFGQVGLVAFISNDPEFDFSTVIDELTVLSREFLTNYVRVSAPEQHLGPCEPLLAREIDCLNWAFLGKTDREIAEITERSYASVRLYIANAANKLGTVNRAQTLAKAAALGYFAFNA